MSLLTVFFADLEMHFAGFSKVQTFCVLTILVALGLGLGEMIDIVFLPSARY